VPSIFRSFLSTGLLEQCVKSHKRRLEEREAFWFFKYINSILTFATLPGFCGKALGFDFMTRFIKGTDTFSN
jgi:hypothetical protein